MERSILGRGERSGGVYLAEFLFLTGVCPMGGIGFVGSGVGFGARRRSGRCFGRCGLVVMSGRFAKGSSFANEDKERRRLERLKSVGRDKLRDERWRRKRKVEGELVKEEETVVQRDRDGERVFRGIRALLQRGRRQDAWTMYKTLDVERLSREIFNRLIHIFGRLHSFKAAELIYIDMQPVCRPDVATFNTILSLQAREKQFDMVRHTFATLKRDEINFNPSVYTYTILIDLCAVEGDLHQAEQLLHEMKRETIPLNPNVATYNALLKGYTRLGDFVNAEKCIERIERAGLSPNQVTYTTMMSAYVRRNDLERATVMFERLKAVEVSPMGRDPVVLTAMVTYYSAVGNFEGVEEIYTEMNRTSWGLDHVALEAVARALVQGGQKEKAVEVTSRLLEDLGDESHRAVSSSSPSSSSFSSWRLLKVVLDRSVEETEEETEEDIRMQVIEWLEGFGVVDDKVRAVLMFNRVLGEYRGDVRKCLFAFDVMRELSIRPNVATFTILMGVFAKRGDVDNTRRFFREMKRAEIEPDRVAWAMLIEAYVTDGDPAGAENVLQNMLESGTKPTVIEYSMVARAHALYSDPQRLDTLLESLNQQGVRPDGIFLNGVLNAYADRKDLPCAEKFLLKMVTAGVDPDVISYNTLIKLHIRKGDLDRAESLLTSIEHPDLVSFNTIIAAAARAGDYQRAMRLFSLLKNTQTPQLKPDVRTYTSLLAGYVTQGHYKEAKTVLDLMHRDNIQPNEITKRYIDRIS